MDVGSFTAYQSSSKVKRLFCSTCGTHMLDNAHDIGGEEWYVAVSIVDAREDTWKIGDHYLLDSTIDGCLSTWLSTLGDEKLRLWKRGANNKPDIQESGDWRHSVDESLQRSTCRKRLRARCHCGGVDFYISPPASAQVHDGLPENMRPKDKTRWYALNDACTSCRLLSSCAVTSWAIVEASHVTLADGSPYKPDLGTTRAYKSSPKVDRTFCSTCGAIVFYQCDELPQYLDVAVGLLEADSGVRAEEWLEWRTHRLAYEEDCTWTSFLRSMKEGLRNYGCGR